MDVLRFELRQQCFSPLFIALVLVFFAIHLVAMSRAGINIGDNELIQYNSIFQIFQTELVLSVFGMLPALIFVVNAGTRDHSVGTAELIYTTPVSRPGFLLGRFSAGTLCALIVGAVGVLGSTVGTLMPWIEPERLGPFRLQPFVACFALIVAPNVLVFCLFSFSVAALSRAATWSFATALAFVVLAFGVNAAGAGAAGPQWLSLLDPFGALAVNEAVRFWNVNELNTQMPIGALPANRVLWLALAVSVFALMCWRFRLGLAEAASKSSSHPTRAKPPAASVARSWSPSFGKRATVAQLLSQLRMDLRAVLLSPLFWLMVIFAMLSTVSEVRNTVSPMMRLPIHLVTSHMLGFFRISLFQFALIVIVFYSALLMHREREHRLHEIIGASPSPDWVMAVSKVITLCSVLMLLMIASMLVSIGLQAMSGQYKFEIGVYLQGLFVNTGFYFCMFAVLACVLQTITPGKWSGMLIVFAVMVGVIILPQVGWGHPLYGFRIPWVTYTDMNGWGHFLPQVYSLVGYWAAFCVLLLIAGHLLLARGSDFGVRARLRDAGTRFTPAIKLTASVATLAFAAIGAWIYYNTNVLADYHSPKARLDAQADFERRYSAYKRKLTAMPVDIEMEVDIYPAERRVVSKGRMTLRNTHATPVDEVFLSAHPRLVFDDLKVEGGAPTVRDAPNGFYVFKLEQPLAPGSERQLQWSATRHNRGFDTSRTDIDILGNGTFFDSLAIMPFPMYGEGRDLTDNRERRKRGLDPAPRLPTLGDPDYLDTLSPGADIPRTSYRVVLSTASDQIAVASGELRREWTQNGRRYFDYVSAQPFRPRFSISSARYQVARDSWNGVPIEVYYDSKHPWNVDTMLRTAKNGLEYYSREFAPYMFPYFRIVEYPGYENHAMAYPGTVPYTETVGFLTDLSGWAPMDLATAHELAHMWWGAMAYGAYMQGRKVLNEGLAEYSTLMMFKQQPNPRWVRELLRDRHSAYIRGRKGASIAEVPVIRADDLHPHLTYGKSAQVLFALQEIIGAEKVNLALRNYLARFGLQPPPYPTTLDLVKELRAVAGPEHQTLITDLFEKIMLYDVQMTAVEVTPIGDQYNVTMEIAAQQFEADGLGNETEVPLDTWFQVVVFPESSDDLIAREPLYLAMHKLRSGAQHLTVRVPARPAAAGVDPFHQMMDKAPDNNIRLLGEQTR